MRVLVTHLDCRFNKQSSIQTHRALPSGVRPHHRRSYLAVIADTFLEFPEIQSVVRLMWVSDQSRYEITCSRTFIGHAATLAGAKDVAHNWVRSLLSQAGMLA